MSYLNPAPPVCPVHGKPTKRRTCPKCNSAYMRGYLRRRQIEKPALAMWHRAKKRADRLNLEFSLSRDTLVIPAYCPVLGIPLRSGSERTANTPSLDRIVSQRGYTDRNTRIISDHANRLKGDLSLEQLTARGRFGSLALRNDYARVVAYVERETLLAEVRAKAAAGGRIGEEWDKIARFLERAFRAGPEVMNAPLQERAR